MSQRPVGGTAMMAGLETSSIVFIPWLMEAADRMGVSNNQYLQKHGEADKGHAAAFVKALQAESTSRDISVEKAERLTEMALTMVFALLREIFNPTHACETD